MDKLAEIQDSAGNVKGGITSITRSGGDALDHRNHGAIHAGMDA